MESPGVTSEGEDLWHVEVEPGDVRVMTLEQLDDLFRLDIVPSSARVWQPGMDEWLPLSVVAGLDDGGEQADEAVEVQPEPVVAPPPPSSRVPPATSPLSTTLPFAGAPSPPSSSLAPPSALLPAAPAAAPPPATSAPPRAEALSSWPPPATVPSGQRPGLSAAPASNVPAANAAPTIPAPFAPSQIPDAPLPSFAPTATSTLSPGRESGSSRLGTALLVCAALFGVCVTLYRNDWLLELARSAGQEGAYTELESAIGSPGFGTPRAVAALDPIADTLSTPPPARLETTPSHDGAASEHDDDDDSASSATSAKAIRTSKKPVRTSQGRPPRRTAQPVRKGNNIGIKGSSNKYDPLNPQL